MISPFPITIGGCGAVSAAGWGAPALTEALRTGKIPPPGEVKPPGGRTGTNHPVRRVPPPPPLDFLRHARQRRTSPISWFAAAAGLEALGPERLAASLSGELRLGLVFTVMNACVQYSGRFFQEVLRDPPTASPILFPETVYNAPGSHLAVLCGVNSAVTTLVGDRAVFFNGVAQAMTWIADDLADSCLVVAAEEADWLTAEGLALSDPGIILGEGAGALLIEHAGNGPHIELAGPYASSATSGPSSPEWERLTRDYPCFTDSVTLSADSDSVQRLNALSVTGECLGASAAIHAVCAARDVLDGNNRSATASVTGHLQRGCLLFTDPRL